MCNEITHLPVPLLNVSAFIEASCTVKDTSLTFRVPYLSLPNFLIVSLVHVFLEPLHLHGGGFGNSLI